MLRDPEFVCRLVGLSFEDLNSEQGKMAPDNSRSHYNVGEERDQTPADNLELATPWSMVSAAQPNSPYRKPGAVAESFLLPDHKRPTVKHDEFTLLEIPVIDLAGCDHGDAAAMESVVAQVREACLHWGFFQIINHGIDEALLSRIQRQANLFFTLPYSEKLKVTKPPGKFAGYGHATVKTGDVRPWSEGFYFTDAESTAELAQKLWPDDTNNDFVYANWALPSLVQMGTISCSESGAPRPEEMIRVYCSQSIGCAR